MERKSKSYLQKRDPEESEVYRAEFIEEIPSGELSEIKGDESPKYPVLKTLGSIGSLVLMIFRAVDMFKNNKGDKRDKNRLRLRKRRRK